MLTIAWNFNHTYSYKTLNFHGTEMYVLNKLLKLFDLHKNIKSNIYRWKTYKTYISIKMGTFMRAPKFISFFFYKMNTPPPPPENGFHISTILSSPETNWMKIFIYLFFIPDIKMSDCNSLSSDDALKMIFHTRNAKQNNLVNHIFYLLKWFTVLNEVNM